MVISMDRWIGKVAVVTGASSGIGATIAQRLVEEGLLVVGMARRSEKIEEMSKKFQNSKGKLYAVKTDITKEEDILSAFKWITNNVGPVHILINNAGTFQETTLIDGDSEKWKKLLDTSVLGLCIATREAVKIMKNSNISGHIIHMNSITGHYVPYFQGWNINPGAKFAVTALTETLRQEFNHLGLKIKISSISPGFVKTEITDSSSTPKFTEAIKDFPMLKTEDITDAVIYVLSTPAHVQVHELTIRPLGEKI